MTDPLVTTLQGSVKETAALEGTIEGTMYGGALENVGVELVGTILTQESIVGTNDYLKLRNKPTIENVELIHDKSFEDLGLTIISEDEIDNIF